LPRSVGGGHRRRPGRHRRRSVILVAGDARECIFDDLPRACLLTRPAPERGAGDVAGSSRGGASSAGVILRRRRRATRLHRRSPASFPDSIASIHPRLGPTILPRAVLLRYAPRFIYASISASKSPSSPDAAAVDRPTCADVYHRSTVSCWVRFISFSTSSGAGGGPCSGGRRRTAPSAAAPARPIACGDGATCMPSTSVRAGDAVGDVPAAVAHRLVGSM